MNMINAGGWQGRTAARTGGVSVQLAAQLHATLGSGVGPAPRDGDPLPLLWHWSAFTPDASMDQLGADGHPEASDIIPPLPFARRMWAGGHLQFFAPLCVGDALTQATTLRSVVQKSGATGEMAFVTLDHEIHGPRGLAVREEQNIVYLPIPETYAPPQKRPMPDAPLRHAVRPMSEALLFRYSAATFNAHRIHYDRSYTQAVEHYPDLVVHGPLQATLLMQMACATKGRLPSLFSFRGVHPMFVNAPLDVMATEDEDGSLSLCTGQSGHQGMTATAIWEATQ